MPTFVMIGQDVPDSAKIREQFHDQHVKHVTALHEKGKIRIAGPMKQDDGERSCGAVIVFEADSLDEAYKVVEADPYVSGGVFEEVTVTPYLIYIPDKV